MSDKKYKKIVSIMIVAAVISIPILFLLSDSREQAVKEVENEFDVTLSKEVYRIKEIKKEPSFHGDGEAAILLGAEAEEIKRIENDLKDYKVLKNSKEYEAIESCIKVLKDRGFDTEIENYDAVFFKQTTDYRFGNFIGLIIDEKNEKILFVKWDS